jgi:hypothetical protein
MVVTVQTIARLTFIEGAVAAGDGFFLFFHQLPFYSKFFWFL